VAENQGQLPPEVAALTADSVTAFNDTNFPLLCGLLSPNYIPALPTDPSLNTANITVCAGTWGETGYSISRDAANRVTVSATTTDNSAVITITR